MTAPFYNEKSMKKARTFYPEPLARDAVYCTDSPSGTGACASFCLGVDSSSPVFVVGFLDNRLDDSKRATKRDRKYTATAHKTKNRSEKTMAIALPVPEFSDAVRVRSPPACTEDSVVLLGVGTSVRKRRNDESEKKGHIIGPLVILGNRRTCGWRCCRLRRWRHSRRGYCRGKCWFHNW